MSGMETPLAAGRTIARTHEADPSLAIAVDGVVLREGAKPFDAKVHAGEVVGLGGLGATAGGIPTDAGRASEADCGQRLGDPRGRHTGNR